ncbi:hypothetical protein HNY73_001365 [Argiope bruennichi]|uniref:Uncharacterized protein n=1 Tax=Argiope bruennichi TaxID=94029 RepID=A0A8T0G127_ARGBR|nr:hypothetical protein HNY73_001365 [Argiope bruennichi]
MKEPLLRPSHFAGVGHLTIHHHVTHHMTTREAGKYPKNTQQWPCVKEFAPIIEYRISIHLTPSTPGKPELVRSLCTPCHRKIKYFEARTDRQGYYLSLAVHQKETKAIWWCASLPFFSIRHMLWLGTVTQNEWPECDASGDPSGLASRLSRCANRDKLLSNLFALR